MIRRNFHSYKIQTIDGKKAIIYFNKNAVEELREIYIEDDEDEFIIRADSVNKLIKYLKRQTTPTQYEAVEKDVAVLLVAYTNGSDRIISWIKGENSAVFGNFTNTGFPSKAYFSTERQAKLLEYFVL